VCIKYLATVTTNKNIEIWSVRNIALCDESLTQALLNILLLAG